MFDKKGTGFIAVKDLEFVLKSFGEKMTDAEIAELIKEAEPKEGQVDYSKFSHKMLTVTKIGKSK